MRILIPRLLPFLYEIRNNRGVGHVGGEVDPNHEDAEAVVCMANWVMAELIRIFHSVSLAEAQAVVDSLVEKRHPLVWEFDGVKRVLNPKMSKSDQTLVLLYSTPGWAEVKTLCGWVEYSSLALFKSSSFSAASREQYKRAAEQPELFDQFLEAAQTQADMHLTMDFKLCSLGWYG